VFKVRKARKKVFDLEPTKGHVKPAISTWAAVLDKKWDFRGRGKATFATKKMLKSVLEKQHIKMGKRM
jgi:hypothetical protein|tara:strand:- start:17 stop:220 length:204 start_codon:yes stop_codon:yes gene_type:complete